MKRRYRNYSNLTRPLINAHRPVLAKKKVQLLSL